MTSGLMVAVDDHQLVRLDENAVVTDGPTDRDSPSQAFEPCFGGAEIGTIEYVWANSPRQAIPGSSILRFQQNLALVSESEIAPGPTFEYTQSQYGNSMCASADGSKLYLYTPYNIDNARAEIYEVDAKTGAVLRTFLPPNVPNWSYLSLSQDGATLFHSAYDADNFEAVGTVDIATGTASTLPWKTDDVNTQIDGIGSEFEVGYNMRAAIELPGGDMLLSGDHGSWARVAKADGTLVKLYNKTPWADYGITQKNLCLSTDGEAFWAGAVTTDPVALGLPMPSGGLTTDTDPNSLAGGPACGVLVKIDVASGDTLASIAMFEFPYQIWPFLVPPVLTLGAHRNRVVAL